MKRLIFLLSIVFCFQMSAQTLTDAQRDSVLVKIQRATSFLANSKPIGLVGRYKVIPTTNTFTSLKLDTATGKVSALQIGLGKESSTMEYKITDAVITDETIIGRFELYPTNNIRNFILLDTIMGFAYQVQWSTNAEECGRWMMWQHLQ